MDKIFKINGKEYKMKCSALVPRIYRHKFGHDLVVDMNNLRTKYNKALAAIKNQELAADEKKAAQLSALDLETFENLAWVFIYHADPENIPDTPDEWLGSLDGMFSIYESFPAIIDLWNESQKTTSTPKNV